MRIKIEAIETLFFRDGKPFNLGAETWADVVFPPYPSVLYGALRSTVLFQKGISFSQADTEKDPSRKLVIKGIYLAVNDNLYLPMPLDCAKEKDSRNNKAMLLKLAERPLSSYPLPKTLGSESEIEAIADGLLHEAIFEHYLRGSKVLFYDRIDRFIRTEPRVGIARNIETKAVLEGRLYRVGMIRPENEKKEKTALVIDFEGIELEERGLLRLGGEGKIVHYARTGNGIEDGMAAFPELDNDMFKIYLSTPALFKHGWLPGWIEEGTFLGELAGIKVKLIAASVGKHISIGGFDYKLGKPKPMKRAVPPGSVYYFQTLSGKAAAGLQEIHGKSVSDYEKEKGFGVAYIGGVNCEKNHHHGGDIHLR